LILAVAAVSSGVRIAAQQHFTVPRADGQSTPLMLYPAIGASASCAPLAVISHGAGGSESGYRYLANAMAQMGYTAVVMGHAESGLAALEDNMRRYGVIEGLSALVADPNAEQARLLDVAATLQWADDRCHAPFRVLLGHSMGAETVMLDAGASNIIGVASPPAGQDRFDAYIALSPEGPGVVFSGDAWSGIQKPMLILAGTRDQSLKGGRWRGSCPGTICPGPCRAATGKE
jgi:dienelactone hydrolase